MHRRPHRRRHLPLLLALVLALVLLSGTARRVAVAVAVATRGAGAGVQQRAAFLLSAAAVAVAGNQRPQDVQGRLARPAQQVVHHARCAHCGPHQRLRSAMRAAAQFNWPRWPTKHHPLQQVRSLTWTSCADLSTHSTRPKRRAARPACEPPAGGAALDVPVKGSSSKGEAAAREEGGGGRGHCRRGSCSLRPALGGAARVCEAQGAHTESAASAWALIEASCQRCLLARTSHVDVPRQAARRDERQARRVHHPRDGLGVLRALEQALKPG